MVRAATLMLLFNCLPPKASILNRYSIYLLLLRIFCPFEVLWRFYLKNIYRKWMRLIWAQCVSILLNCAIYCILYHRPSFYLAPLLCIFTFDVFQSRTRLHIENLITHFCASYQFNLLNIASNICFMWNQTYFYANFIFFSISVQL